MYKLTPKIAKGSIQYYPIGYAVFVKAKFSKAAIVEGHLVVGYSAKPFFGLDPPAKPLAPAPKSEAWYLIAKSLDDGRHRYLTCEQLKKEIASGGVYAAVDVDTIFDKLIKGD